MSGTSHISSLLVNAKPDFLKSVVTAVQQIDIAQVAQTDERSKIIVTLETDDESQIVQVLTDIQLIDGVVSAGLVFHHVEDNEKLNEPVS